MGKRGPIIITLTVIAFLAVLGGTYTLRVVQEHPRPLVEAQPGQLNIGAIIPLTGEAAAVGLPIRQAAELAIQEINDAGGVNGQPVRFIVEDGRCDPRTAVTGAEKLIAQYAVPIIFAGGCSSETLAVAPIAERQGRILFSPSATSPAITTAGDYVFRSAPSDASQGKILAEAAWARGYDTVGVLVEETDYAVGIADVFQRSFEALGGTVVSKFTGTDAATVSPQLTELMQPATDALLFIAQTPSTADLVLSALEASPRPVPLLTNDVVMGSAEVLRGHAALVEGMLGADLDVDATRPAFQEFIKRYQAASGEDVAFPYYAALSYDAVHLLVDVVRTAGLDPDAIRQALSQVRERPGAAGQLTLDEHGDPVAGHILKQITKGVAVQVPVMSEQVHEVKEGL